MYTNFVKLQNPHKFCEKIMKQRKNVNFFLSKEKNSAVSGSPPSSTVTFQKIYCKFKIFMFRITPGLQFVFMNILHDLHYAEFLLLIH